MHPNTRPHLVPMKHAPAGANKNHGGRATGASHNQMHYAAEGDDRRVNGTAETASSTRESDALESLRRLNDARRHSLAASHSRGPDTRTESPRTPEESSSHSLPLSAAEQSRVDQLYKLSCEKGQDPQAGSPAHAAKWQAYMTQQRAESGSEAFSKLLTALERDFHQTTEGDARVQRELAPHPQVERWETARQQMARQEKELNEQHQAGKRTE